MMSLAKFLLNKAAIVLATGAILCCGNLKAQAFTYDLDDGVSSNSVGDEDLDFLWLNSYTVQPGAEKITGISLAWGSPLAPSNLSGGETTTVLLYLDPNGDGDPIDAVLLANASTTVTNPDTDSFTTVAITPTTLTAGDVFFVAALLTTNGLQFPASADDSSFVSGVSWAGGYAAGTFDPNDPNNLIPDLGNNEYLVLNESFLLNANYLLRAEAVAADSIPFEFNPALGIVILTGLWGGNKLYQRFKSNP